MKNEAWKAIFDKWGIFKHNFDMEPYIITAQQIKEATIHFTKSKRYN